MADASKHGLAPVRVAGEHFAVAGCNKHFVPLGFNYDHDEHYRLLEDYWQDEWHKVVRDFTAMHDLGANTVRIHLQAGQFLTATDSLCSAQLHQLDCLVALATSLQLRLHIVGLGCYHSHAVPAWYAQQDDGARWQTQAFFWQALAARYRSNGTIFCFDLMNEPLVPARQRHERGWLGQDYHGSHFTQYISLDGTQAPRSEIARRWITTLTHAIRREDPQRLITIGLVDWSLPHCKPNSGFAPEQVAPLLDFIGLHIYPEGGQLAAALATVQQFRVGKPLVVDESFPLRCTATEFADFLTAIRPLVNGVLGFYTDQVAEPVTEHHHLRNQAMQDWLSVFASALLDPEGTGL